MTFPTPSHGLKWPHIIALGDCNSQTTDPAQGTVPAAVVTYLEQLSIQPRLTNLAGGMETCREGLFRLATCDTKADIVLINYGLVDAWITSIPQLHVRCYPNTFLRKRVRKLVKFVKRQLLRSRLMSWVPRGNVIPEAEFYASIERIISMVRQKNSAARCYIWSTIPVTNSDARNVQLSRYNELLRKVAVANAAIFIDSLAAIQELPGPQQLLDHVHLTHETANLIGQTIGSHYLNASQSSCRPAA